MRGLLGRGELERGEGLLLEPAGSIHTFFMRFPIDAVFLDRGLRVVGLAPELAPWRLEPGDAAARRDLDSRRTDEEVPARPRILLVGHDRRFLRVTAFLLAREGFDVQATYDAPRLVELVEAHAADVAVLEPDGSAV